MSILDEVKKLILKKGGSIAGVYSIEDGIKALIKLANHDASGIHNISDAIRRYAGMSEYQYTFKQGRIMRNAESDAKELIESPSTKHAWTMICAAGDIQISFSDGFQGIAWKCSSPSLGHIAASVITGYGNAGTYTYSPIYKYVYICVKKEDESVITVEEATSAMTITE